MAGQVLGYYPMAQYFSCLVFMFGGGVFGCMVAYTIMNLPKNLMSIGSGLTQFIMGMLSLLAIYMALPLPGNKNPLVSMKFREDYAMNGRFLALLHVSVGVMIISDSLFLKEKNPTSTSGPIGSVLFQLLIAGAGAQGAGMMTSLLIICLGGPATA